MPNLMTTKKLVGLRAVDAHRGKRIGKVHHFVFHPTERRCIGFTIKRPDAALMFHRKDLFVSLTGFHIEEGQVVVHDDAAATEWGAIKALGVNWDACVIWVGMPVMTKSGDMLGYVDAVVFECETGMVSRITTENGAASDVIVGKRSIPGKLIKGFRRGQGVALAPMGQYSGEDESAVVERGAILVSDEALDIPIEGGAAAAAGKASAIVTNKAKKGAVRVKVAASEQAQKARPTVKRVAEKTGEAVDAGSFAVGKQLGRATGMFAAFKEEFDKASKGEGE